MRLVVAVVALLLAALTACSSPAPAAPEPFGVPTTSPAPVTRTPAEDELYGPRVELPGGLYLKQLGKVVEYTVTPTSPSSEWTMRFVIDAIAVDPKCQYTVKPERGHRLLLTVRVETSGRFEADGLAPNYNDFSTIGPDGVTEGPMGTNSPCRAATALPIQLRPSAKYRGEITLDTGNPRGRLVLGNTVAWDYPT